MSNSVVFYFFYFHSSTSLPVMTSCTCGKPIPPQFREVGEMIADELSHMLGIPIAFYMNKEGKKAESDLMESWIQENPTHSLNKQVCNMGVQIPPSLVKQKDEAYILERVMEIFKLMHKSPLLQKEKVLCYISYDVFDNYSYGDVTFLCTIITLEKKE